MKLLLVVDVLKCLLQDLCQNLDFQAITAKFDFLCRPADILQIQQKNLPAFFNIRSTSFSFSFKVILCDIISISLPKNLLLQTRLVSIRFRIQHLNSFEQFVFPLFYPSYNWSAVPCTAPSNVYILLSDGRTFRSGIGQST